MDLSLDRILNELMSNCLQTVPNLLRTVRCRTAALYDWSLFLLTFLASNQQDRQCTYHVTPWLVRASIY